MRNYENPKIRVFELPKEDVVTTSDWSAMSSADDNGEWKNGWSTKGGILE